MKTKHIALGICIVFFGLVIVSCGSETDKDNPFIGKTFNLSEGTSVLAFGEKNWAWSNHRDHGSVKGTYTYTLNVEPGKDRAVMEVKRQHQEGGTWNSYEQIWTAILTHLDNGRTRINVIYSAP